MIITPLNLTQLKQIFNQDAQSVINYFIFKAVISQPELTQGQKVNPIQIPKEHIEQWGVQALRLKSIGAGNYPIDLIDKTGSFGVDIKMLAWSADKTESNETSLGQKFDVEVKLDTLFLSKNYDQIVKEWIDILDDKYSSLFEKHPNLKNIYYFILVREGSKFHIAGMTVDTKKFYLMKKENVSNKSVWLDNFIDKNYGRIKIYSSKKRMEFRLKPQKWIDSNSVITFDIPDYKIPPRDIIDLTMSERYKGYKEDFDKLFDSYCDYTNDD